MSINYRIHHLGYLVKSIEKSAQIFRQIGYIDVGEAVYDDFREIEILFMEKDGYQIELVSPKTQTSVVAELRKKIKNSPYHICYEVDNINEAIEDLESQRFVVCQPKHEAIALCGKKVAFLIHSQIGLIEIVEK